jgi:outer membrane lipoprotein-sorting protein
MTLQKAKWVMETTGMAMMAAALVAVSAAIAAQAPAPSGTKQYRPFTAKYIRTYLSERGRMKTFSGTFYRRADGAFSDISETEAGGTPGKSRDILIPADRSFTLADSFTGTSTTTLLLEERRFQNLMDRESGTCDILKDESVKRLGESELLGLKVIEVEEPFGRSTVFRKTIAPELWCFALQKLDIDHGAVRTITQVTQITFGEPDPEAFRPPADYTEVSPMELNARWRALFGYDFFDPAVAQRREQDYQQGRERQRQQGNR